MEPAELELFKLAGWESSSTVVQMNRGELPPPPPPLRRLFSHRRRLRHKLPPKLAPFAAVKLVKAYALRRCTHAERVGRRQHRGIYTAACVLNILAHSRTTQRNKDLSQRAAPKELLLSRSRARCYLARAIGTGLRLGLAALHFKTSANN